MSFQKQLKSGDSDEYVRHAVSKNLYDPRSINELENKFARDVVEKLKHLVLNDAQIGSEQEDGSVRKGSNTFYVCCRADWNRTASGQMTSKYTVGSRSMMKIMMS
jgi:hypothetical protein